MNEALDKKLCEDFPDLYVDRHADMMTTCMCWGFETGDGWEPLIRKLSEQLTWLAKAQDVPIKASQVKEKFGTLRFYIEGGTDISYACIAAAEQRSANTCEYCGDDNYAKTRSRGGWLRTLCVQCAVTNHYHIEDWEAERFGIKLTDPTQP